MDFPSANCRERYREISEREQAVIVGRVVRMGCVMVGYCIGLVVVVLVVLGFVVG